MLYIFVVVVVLLHQVLLLLLLRELGPFLFFWLYGSAAQTGLLKTKGKNKEEASSSPSELEEFVFFLDGVLDGFLICALQDSLRFSVASS